ncbi:hypothetical protein JCM3765_007898 [Sporobolomyces pararoseus]
MSLDVHSDPRISQLYNSIRLTDSPIDWCLFGYRRTNNQLQVYESGSAGIDELREQLVPNEVQYGLLKVEGRVVLFSLIPETINGVKRARALVHSRSLANVFKFHHALFPCTSPIDFQLSHIRSVLRLPPLPLHQQSRVDPHSRSVSNSDNSNSLSSPSASTLDQSIVSNNSTIHPPSRTTVAGAQGSKGKEKAIEQNLPQFDLYHEYESSSTSPPSRSREHDPVDVDEGHPPELPEKPPSPYHLQQPYLNSSSSSRSPSPTSQLPNHRNSLSPPPTSSSTTHKGPPLSLSAPLPPPVSSTSQEQVSKNSNHTTRPVSESPAALMMLSPTRDSRYDTIYGSGNGNDDFSTSTTPLDEHDQPHRLESTFEEDEDEEDEEEEEEQRVQDTTNPPDDQKGNSRNENVGESRGTQEEEEEEEDGILDSYGRDDEDEFAKVRDGNVDESELEQARRKREIEELERVRLEEEEEKAAHERELRALEERLRLEREAAEAERERQRQLELEREVERLRLQKEEEEAEAERTRKAKEEMRLMIEREKLEKKLREEEERRKRELERLRLKEESKRMLVENRDSGQVMLSGEVSVQGGGSMLWRRRYYELRGTAISFSKSQSESSTPLDTVLSSSIASIISHPDEPLPPHSFKILLQDEDEWLFYGDNEEQKEMLIEGLKVAARLS